MTIYTRNTYSNSIYQYSTEIVNPGESYEMEFMVESFLHYEFDGTIDADEDDLYGVILTPRTGKEEKIRRFLAIGRLANPDFPFRLQEEE